ncbi:MAG: hypothetical protein HFJ12_05205 [Bacilli bacterium]|nr:hypothetical protein [Bacilli bacterium]
MLELLGKVESLKKELDQLEIWKHLYQAKNSVYQNRELMDKIKRYQETLNSQLRLEIYCYDEIRKYKKLENEVNFIIMEINHKLSILSGAKGYHNENC